MSALFHNDNLLARSYSALDVRPARVRLMCGPEPLWEHSATFTLEELARYKARTKELNQHFARLSNATGNGGTKSPFKEFHNNLIPDMCYVEDIFHTRCNHWAKKPRVFHRCPAAETSNPGSHCFNKKTCGSAEEDSLCQKCASISLHKLGTGTSVLSVGQDHKTGKVVVIKGEKKEAVSQAKPEPQEQGPSGFTGWRIDD